MTHVSAMAIIEAWPFYPAAQPPQLEPGQSKQVIVVSEREGERFTYAAYYLQGFPLLYEECVCVDGETQHHSDGCPTTGWYYDQSNFEFEHCFWPIEGTVIAWAEIPTPAQIAL
jgi:hypothetical protein